MAPGRLMGAGEHVSATWEKERSQVFRGSAGMLVGSAITGASSVLVLLAVARLSDQATTGAFAAATSIFLIAVAFSRLGAPTTLVYFVSRLAASPAAGAIPGLARRVLATIAIASAAVALVLIIGGDGLIASLSAESAGGLMDLGPMLWFLPMAALLECVLAISQGLQRMRPTIAVDQTMRPIAQLVLVMLALLAGRPEWAAAAWALPYLPSLAWSWAWTRSLLPGLAPRAPHGAVPAAGAPGAQGREMAVPAGGAHAAVEPSGRAPQPPSGRAFWRYAGPRWLAGFIQMVLQRVDIVIVAAIAGVAQAAIYTAATRFVVLGQMVQLSLGRVVQPRLSGALGDGDIDRTRSLYATTTTWLVLLVWPVFLGLAIAAAPLMAMFGPEYEAGVQVVWILSAGMVVATGVGVADTVLIMSGRSGAGLVNQILALAVMLAVDLTLIPTLGINGAALGWALALVTRSLLPLVQNHRRLGVSPFSRQMVTAAAVNLVCFVGVGAPTLVLLPSSWGWIAAVAAASLCYVSAVVALRDRLGLASLVPGILGRTRGGRR